MCLIQSIKRSQSEQMNITLRLYSNIESRRTKTKLSSPSSVSIHHSDVMAALMITPAATLSPSSQLASFPGTHDLVLNFTAGPAMKLPCLASTAGGGEMG